MKRPRTYLICYHLLIYATSIVGWILRVLVRPEILLKKTMGKCILTCLYAFIWKCNVLHQGDTYNVTSRKIKVSAFV